MVNRTPTPFRQPTRKECELLEQFYKAKFGAEQAAELVSSGRIAVLDYIPDSPGEFGSILLISHGAGMEYYEVYKIKKGSEISYMPPAEAITTMHQPADESNPLTECYGCGKHVRYPNFISEKAYCDICVGTLDEIPY